MILDIFNAETSYSPDYESFCFENCIRQLLEFYKIQDAYQFLDVSLDLKVVERLNEGFTVTTNNRPVLPQYLHKIKAHVADNDQFYKVWEKNKKKIQKNIPLIVAVDPFYLEYTTLYNKDHAGHSLILCGFSADEEYVNIVDHYEWVYKGEVKFEQYLKARSSSNPKTEAIYSGSSINNTWFEIEREGWKGNKQKLLLQIINSTIDQFYNPGIKKANIHQGMNGIKLVFNRVLNYQEKETELKGLLLNKLYRTLRPLLKKKKLFKHYLAQSLSDILPEEFYQDLMTLLDNNTNDWNMLLLTAVRGSMMKTEKTFEQVVSIFDGIISDEEKIYKYLLDLKVQVSARK